MDADEGGVVERDGSGKERMGMNDENRPRSHTQASHMVLAEAPTAIALADSG